MPRISLKITGADGASRTVDTDQDSFILGSGAGAAIKLDDTLVSSVHAMIKVDSNGDLAVIDLGSEKGTLLDGRPVRDSALKPGSTLKLGGTSIVVSKRVDPSEMETAVDREVPLALRDAAAKAGRAAPAPAPAARPASRPVAAVALKAQPQPASKPHLRDARAVQIDHLLADRFLKDELSPELTPTKTERLLQVALVWGHDAFIELGSYSKGKTVRVGPAPTADLHLYSQKLPTDDFPLFVANGDEVTVSIADGVHVVVSRDDDEKELPALVASGWAKPVQAPFKGHSYQLALEDRVIVDLGNMTVIARWVRPERAKQPTLLETIDFAFAKWLLIAFVLLVAFLGIVHLTPMDLDELTGDLFKNKQTLSKFIMNVPEPPKKFKELSGVKEGAKAKGDEGKFGKKDAKQKEAAPSKKGAPVVDKNKREEDRLKIQKSGLLQALGKLGGDSAVSNVLGPGGLGTGINNALGGLKGGAGMGDAQGVGGLGSRGTGSGGGGTALGIGGLGTHGSGHGAGGYGTIDLGGRGKDDTTFVPGKITMSDGLSRDVIGRIIQRHWNEIKYCYESELSKDPNLYGKVAVLFIIGGDGGVADAQITQSTMGNQNVEGCMTNHIKRWKFPEPKGGGTVNVTYPWVFKPAG